MKKVKQISIDILVDEEKDGCVLAEQIAKDLEAEGNVVLGSVFQADMTKLYERDYLELLGKKEESKEKFWGEEICPYCDYVNNFVCDGTSRKITCKNCGKEILLCSLCDMDKVSCGKCPYETEIIEKRIQEMLIREAEENECTVEEIKQILIDDWGKGGDRGYGIFISDSPELQHIERIDVLGVYDGDLEAGEQAEKDGIKLIPLEENPKEYPYNCYRFIDTEENRKILEEIKRMEN